MPGQIFLIPFPNYPGLVELQDYLRQKLPEGTIYNDPASFHISLVYTDGMGSDLAGVSVPQNLPVFGVGGYEISAWDTPEGWAVVLRIEKNPQLVYLQAYLFYEVLQKVSGVSGYSWAGMWQPHITLATVPPGTGWGDTYIPLPNPQHLPIDRFELWQESQVLQSYSLLPTLTRQQVAEMAVVREVMEWSFKGDFPEVPIAAGVNVKELAGGDDDPLFVTLPAFEVDKPSANKRLISKEVALEIVRQIVTDKPGGIMGHLRDEDRDSKFPIPDVYWVGATLKNGIVWVKGYVPKGEVREMLRTMKAVGSKVALSIYGVAEHVWDKARGAWVLSEMTLEQIDLAPPKRSGFGLAVVPHVTAEMKSTASPLPPLPPHPQPLPINGEGSHGRVSIGGEGVGDNDGSEGDLTMDREQIIKEMGLGDVSLVPQTVREVIQREVPQIKVVAELRGTLNLSDDDDLVKVVSEMASRFAELRQAAIENSIRHEVAAQVMADAAQETEGVKAVREMVASLVRAKHPADPNAVAGLVTEVAQQDYVKEMVGKIIIAEMGPVHNRRVTGAPAKNGAGNKYFEIPVDEE